MKRVVVTGMGIVSSIGNDADEVLASLRDARSGISHAPEYEELGFRCHVHGKPTLDPFEMLDRREARFLALTGEPALALLVDGRLDTVTTLALRDGKAALILGLRNPAKLRRIADALKIPLAAPVAANRPTLPGR